MSSVGNQGLSWGLECLFKCRLIYPRAENQYSLDKLEQSETHDPYWDAAMVSKTNIYRMLRYLNESGLERKFEMDAYLNKVSLR